MRMHLNGRSEIKEESLFTSLPTRHKWRGRVSIYDMAEFYSTLVVWFGGYAD